MHQIVFEKGLIEKSDWIFQWKHYANRWVIITDDRVKPLWGDSLHTLLKQNGIDAPLLSIPEGEVSKTRKTKEHIEDLMLSQGFGRDSGIIALGGGVITDLAGFIAATYCRGIPFISIPTTLMAMVDASIGGKVAVNTAFAKNMIGAFYLPKMVYVDCNFLQTLPSKEVLNGFAEILKYGLICKEEILTHSMLSEEIIATCCKLKQMIVEKDPCEKGLRRILNYGHTVGHALETVSEYQISHGEAIALGMIAEGYLSFRLGYISEKDFHRIYEVFADRGYQLKMPENITSDDLKKCMSIDKKSDSRIPRFVFLEKIGEAKTFDGAYCSTVNSDILEEMLTWMVSQYTQKKLCRV